jgi:hypothetical protein
MKRKNRKFNLNKKIYPLILILVTNIGLISFANTDVVVESKENKIENNLENNNYSLQGEDKNNYLVEGGNENAVNNLATEQSISNATLTENVNIEGKSYDLKVPTENDFNTKDPLELRQFITFETKSGKVFHLIIDHSIEKDNVMMLTEVSEQDLLNIIEEESGVDINTVNIENIIEQEDNLVVEEISKDSTTENSQIDEKRESDRSLILIGVFAVLSGALGWYFKIYKPKQHVNNDEDIDEMEYISDESENEL